MSGVRQNVPQAAMDSDSSRLRQTLMFAPEYPKLQSLERKGVVYTKEWVVHFILD